MKRFQKFTLYSIMFIAGLASIYFLYSFFEYLIKYVAENEVIVKSTLSAAMKVSFISFLVCFVIGTALSSIISLLISIDGKIENNNTK